MPAFSFDASAFINPYRRYYPFDIAPSYWTKLEEKIADGAIVATEVVRDEIEPKDDALRKWARGQNGLFLQVTDHQIECVRAILDRFAHWIDENTGKNNADPFVIALAMHANLVVVSEENNGSEKHPTIPYVCRTMKVEHIRVPEFLRRIGHRM